MLHQGWIQNIWLGGGRRVRCGRDTYLSIVGLRREPSALPRKNRFLIGNGMFWCPVSGIFVCAPYQKIC